MHSAPMTRSTTRPPTRCSRTASLLQGLLLALLLALAGMLHPALARRAEAGAGSADTLSADAAPVRVRLGVITDGITVVTPDDLAGIDPGLAKADPDTFALSSLGQPVAIHVTDEGNGVFDGADRLYFFGEKFRGEEMDQKYTDERVYWLDIGGSAGPPMAVQDAAPLGNLTPPADFAATIRAEESNVWWTLHTLSLDTKDTWFWSRLKPLSSSLASATSIAPQTQPLDGAGAGFTAVSAQAATVALAFTVPFPAAGAGALRLEEISDAGLWNVNPDHWTLAALNGTPVLDETWDGHPVRKVFSAAVPPNTLVHGANTLDVVAELLPDVSSDDIYVNYLELDCRRQFIAWEDRLDFVSETPGPMEYEAAGWSSPDVMIWDITAETQPVRLQAPPASGSPFKVRFRADAPEGRRYWLQTAASARRPHSVRLRPPTDLRDGKAGADAVIVTSTELRPAADQLAQWHLDHGRRVRVVDIKDTYDEFNNGIYHPKAVQAMMKWAVANWAPPAPAYLTLVGDGHWNFKNYNPADYPPQPNHIPPYLAWVDPWLGEVPADVLFGDIDDDRAPEIAVGRLAVNTLAEAQIVVEKIVSYDETARVAGWQRRALFVADNPDSSIDFRAVSDQIVAGYTPDDLRVVRAYLPGDTNTPATPDEIAATRATIADTIQSGALFVQYTGHGSVNRWTQEGIWRSMNIPALTNGSKLPLVMTFNCLDGYFAHPNSASFSMAELMQRHAGGGSVAAISPSGLGTTTDQLAFRKILLDVMFGDNVREVGRALTIAKQQFSQVQADGKHYLIDTMTLFGDPAMRLPGLAMSSFLPLAAR